MARKKPVFSLAQWASLNEAFARAKAALHSASLAERDLVERMRSGELPSAVRRIPRDGSATTFDLLKPGFWKGPTLLATLRTVQVHGLDPKHIASATLWFCVARDALDKVYPVGGAQPVPIADNVMSRNKAEPLPPRKPGPTPKHDWKLHVAAEVLRRVRAGEKDPTAPAMVRYCIDTIGHDPDDSAMRKLLKFLLRR